jgi:3-dehydroquinate synthase
MTKPSASKQSPPPHRTVRVDLGPRSYDVLIGRGILETLGDELQQRQLTGRAVVVTDSAVSSLAMTNAFWKTDAPSKILVPRLHGGIANDRIVPPGEESKNLLQVHELLKTWARQQIPRTGVVFALGGGVIGDLAGFAAAIYLRGIPVVQIPTTLLAMVDSSVGGKTGVNLPEGKNLVGSFHQPSLVLADLDTLKTLPAQEFAAGMAEVIKYGVIADRALFDRVAKGVKPDDDDLGEIIEKCVAIKARIVEQDEFERKGLRAILNFGHTIGHAIEKATGYKKYLHGEAVALGMRAAAWLSHWDGMLPLEDVQSLGKALIANNLPDHLDEPDDSNAIILTHAILNALGNDKKVAEDGKNRWVLLKSLGEAETDIQIELRDVEAALNKLLVPVR